ncbi:MAG TPA: alpha/beta hydrolase [Methylococcus sp.]|nr:alpha/beta hydrolase [Methylococcus sp.]
MIFLFRVVLGLAAAMAFLYMIQEQLLYFPHRYDRPTAALLAARVALRPWPEIEGYRGFIGPEPEGIRQGTVAVFHGNAGSAVDRVAYTLLFRPLGYRVILLEYPGYGAREGALREAVLVADGAESLRAIRESQGSPLYVLGESLGAAVATGAVADSGVIVAGLVLCTPWDDLPSLAQSIYWFLPVRSLVRDRYDNVERLRSYRGPLATIVAERDEIVPERSSLKVHESYSGPKKLWTLRGGHNTWLMATNPAWWREVFRFLQEANPQAPAR